MSTLPKINITLLKRLVEELESTLNFSEDLQQELSANKNEYVIEMSKALGIATGITLEASMLIMDIQTLTQTASGAAPTSSGKEDSIKSLLSLLKGGAKPTSKN